MTTSATTAKTGPKRAGTTAPSTDASTTGSRHAFRFGATAIVATAAPDQPEGIEALARRWARPIERALVQAGQMPVTLTPHAPIVATLAEWQGTQATSPAIALVPMSGTGGLLFTIDRMLVARMLDIFYGGDGRGPLRRRQAERLSNAETILIERLVTAVLPTLAGALPGFPTGTRGRVIDPVDLALDPEGPRGPLAALSFDATLGGTPGGTISLLMPLALVTATVDTPPAGGQPVLERPLKWQAALAARVGDIRVPARSVLARPTMTLAQLARLRRGDIIPIGVPNRVPLIVGNHQLATGTIGERDGRAAFQIEAMNEERLS